MSIRIGSSPPMELYRCVRFFSCCCCGYYHFCGEISVSFRGEGQTFVPSRTIAPHHRTRLDLESERMQFIPFNSGGIRSSIILVRASVSSIRIRRGVFFPFSADYYTILPARSADSCRNNHSQISSRCNPCTTSGMESCSRRLRLSRVVVVRLLMRCSVCQRSRSSNSYQS